MGGSFTAENRRNNVDRKWIGQWVIAGRFGKKYALVHFGWSYFEVGLVDMRPANSLFGIVGCDGALTLHSARANFPEHYLVGARTLVFLIKMRTEYLRSSQTAWANTYTRLRPLTFYEPDLHRRIAIRELGWEGKFNDFINHL